MKLSPMFWACSFLVFVIGGIVNYNINRAADRADIINRLILIEQQALVDRLVMGHKIRQGQEILRRLNEELDGMAEKRDSEDDSI